MIVAFWNAFSSKKGRRCKMEETLQNQSLNRNTGNSM